MNRLTRSLMNAALSLLFTLAGALFLASEAPAGDLNEIRQRGVLRHLGVPYAHFVRHTDKGLDGLDVELMRRFAVHLGVDYEWVKTSWSTVISDLTGKATRPAAGGNVLIGDPVAVRGDIIANGLTILQWREKVVDYSTPTFPTGVWLMARADSPLKPITPSSDIHTDIRLVKSRLAGRSVLTMRNTCIDPRLYDLESTGALIRYHTATESLDDIAPAIIDGVAEATLLDIPDALVAIQKWPGEIKIIGPLSTPQFMGVATPKTSKKLLAEFNIFFEQLRATGDYNELVRKYYPSVFLYLGEFFESK